MNHLAHVFLAGPQAAAQLGAMLGDFWRGAPDITWPDGVGAGVILHRKIDVYTDSHPAVAAARNLFEPPFRRYAGILLDVYFDHTLARDWSRYSNESLDALSTHTLDLLAANAVWLPSDLNRFAAYMSARSLFGRYAERTMIEEVLTGISGRLSRANPLAEAGSMLWQHAAALDKCFERFFPELRMEASRQRTLLGLA